MRKETLHFQPEAAGAARRELLPAFALACALLLSPCANAAENRADQTDEARKELELTRQQLQDARQLMHQQNGVQSWSEASRPAQSQAGAGAQAQAPGPGDENGYMGTYTDSNGDIVTSVIAPKRPQQDTQDYPIIVEPQIGGYDWNGGSYGGYGWNGGGFRPLPPPQPMPGQQGFNPGWYGGPGNPGNTPGWRPHPGFDGPGRPDGYDRPGRPDIPGRPGRPGFPGNPSIWQPGMNPPNWNDGPDRPGSGNWTPPPGWQGRPEPGPGAGPGNTPGWQGGSGSSWNPPTAPPGTGPNWRPNPPGGQNPAPGQLPGQIPGQVPGQGNGSINAPGGVGGNIPGGGMGMPPAPGPQGAWHNQLHPWQHGQPGQHAALMPPRNPGRPGSPPLGPWHAPRQGMHPYFTQRFQPVYAPAPFRAGSQSSGRRWSVPGEAGAWAPANWGRF